MVLRLLLTKFSLAVPCRRYFRESPVQERELFYLSIEDLSAEYELKFRDVRLR